MLSFQNVKKSYHNHEALKGVSFSVQEGEFFALLGQNGAGKTTLINCLSGALDQSSGEILVDGYNTQKDPQITKNTLGIVEQELTFDPFLTPLETISMVQGFYGIAPTKENIDYLHWLLEKLSLGNKKNADAKELSGGMKRRLMIAKALCHKPKVLILDEPTAGVDIELRRDLWVFIEELRKTQNLTVLLTTHYLEEAQELSERVAILHKGEIIVCDDTQKLLSTQKRTLLITLSDGSEKSFTIENDEDIVKNIEQCTNISNIKIQEPKLEDIFWEYTHNN